MKRKIAWGVSIVVLFFIFSPILVHAATFGRTDEGGSQWSVEGFIRGTRATMPADGTGVSMSLYLEITTAAKNCYCAIYNETDDTLIDNTTLTNVGTQASTLTTFTGLSESLYENDEYILVCWCSGGAGAAYASYDDGVSDYGHYQSLALTDWPSPASFTHEDKNFTMYVTYTPIFIAVDSPTNTTYGTSTYWANVTTVSAADKCFYSEDAGTNTSMSNTSTTAWYKSVSSSAGSHNVEFACNDTGSTMYKSEDPTYFSLNPNAPTYTTNGTNTTNGSTIEKYAGISVYAQWNDNFELDEYWIERNETASGVNQSHASFTTGNWSNLTFSTSGADFGAGETIMARIFANDTGGNEAKDGVWVWTIDGTVPTYSKQNSNTSNGSLVIKNAGVTLFAQWNDNKRLHYYWYETNGTGSFSNLSETAFTGANWSNFTVDTGAYTNNFRLRLFGNDTSGNEVKDGVWEFTMDTTSPTYSTNGTNTTNNTAQTRGVGIKIWAQWDDAVELHKYINSTKRGGSWENTSGAYGTNNWTNLSINTDGYTGDLIVKIYGNDTSGNEHVTGTWKWTFGSATPSVSARTIGPDIRYQSSDLDCNATLQDLDNSSGLVAYFRWFNDGVLNLTGTKTTISNATDTTISTIKSGNTSLGEQWICEVTPNDGTQNGTVLNTSTITVGIHTPAEDTIYTDTIYLVRATYKFNDTELDGVLRMDCDNCFLDCNHTVLEGNDTLNSFAINVTDQVNVGIRNCTIYDYGHGIRAYNATGLHVNNSIINSTVDYGIYLNKANDTIIYNNTIKYTEDDGVYVGYANNTQVSFNWIENASANQYGTEVYDSWNVEIFNNTYKNNVYDAIHASTEYDLWIYNNTFMGNQYVFSGSMFDSNFSHNTMYNGTYGIHLVDSDTNKFWDNMLTNASQFLVQFTGDSDDNEFWDNEIANGSVSGLDLANPASNNNVVWNGTFHGSNRNIYVHSLSAGACNLTILDSEITGGVVSDVYADTIYGVYVINATGYTNSKIAGANSAWIVMGWWVTVYANDTGGSALNNVNITANDTVNQGYQWWKTTGANGWTNTSHRLGRAITWSWNQTASKAWFNPTFNASLTGYDMPAEQQINVTSNTVVYFELEETALGNPAWWKIGQNVTNGTTVSNNEHIALSAQWNITSGDLDKYWVYNATHNMTVSSFSTGNWTNTTWNTSGLTKGTTYSLMIYANDTNGNENVTSLWAYTIDNTIPTYSNVETNVTNGSMISKHEGLLLTGQWNDNVRLDEYWYESNGTGSYANSSTTEFSTGNWSNITIDASSYTTFPFRIRVFTNDTSNNEDSILYEFDGDETSPTFSNTLQNVTNTTIVWDQEVIEIIDQWNDNMDLDKYWLEDSTNGTAQLFSGDNWTNQTWDADGKSAGLHTLRMFANDTSNNEAKGGVWQYTIDNTVPTFSNVGQNQTNTSTIRLSEDVALSAQWNDDVQLHRWIFYNGTHNLTAGSFSAGNWSNSTWNSSGLTKGTTYTLKVIANDTSGNDVQGPVWQYTIDNTAPTVTFLTQTPSDIMWNSSGVFNVTFNITDVVDVNETSIVFFSSINHSDGTVVHYNWSFRYPESTKQPLGQRGDNRNESRWWDYDQEDLIKREYGSEDIWSWAGGAFSSQYVSILDNATAYAHVNVSMEDVHKMFTQSWYVDRTDMLRENKTNQYIDIYKKNPVNIEFNLSEHDLLENFTGYVHLNIEPQASGEDLISYICNSSYINGEPSKDDNCQAGFHITGGESRTLNMSNSSYISNSGGVIDGYYGSVLVTRQMHLILVCVETNSDLAYRLYYANNSVADNIDFDNTNVTWTSTDGGDTWTQYLGTSDVWYSWSQASYDTILYYVYVCDNSGNCVNSTIQTDTMEAESNQPPGEPTITNPTKDQNVSGTLNVTWTTIGDPEGDDYNASVILYYKNGTTANETLANDNVSTTWYNFDTTTKDDDIWRLNITLCDENDACSHSIGSNFTIDNTYPTWSNVGNNVTNNTVTSVYENIALSAQWNDRDLDKYILFDGSNNKTWVDFAAGNWTNTTWNSSGLTKGSTYVMKYYANDSAGNDIQGPVWQYTIDNSVPTFSNVGTNVTNNTVTSVFENIALSTQWNDDVRLENWWFYNGTHNMTATIFSAGNWSNSTFNTSLLTKGSSYTPKFYANDTSGNEVQGGLWKYTIDNTVPTWSNTGQNVTNNTVISLYEHVAFSTQWNDNVRLDNWWFNNGTHNMSAGTFSAGNWSNSTWNVSLLTQGNSYTPRFYANDTSGNEVLGGYWRYTIDNTNPTWSNVGQNVTNNTIISIHEHIDFSAQWNDDVRLDKYIFYDGSNNLTWVDFAAGNWTNTTWNSTGLTKGSTYTPRFYANDTSNNDVRGPLWSYTIDNTIPTFSNVGQNVTNNTVVPTGRIIEVSAQWNDDVRLDRNWLENTTNGTEVLFTGGNWSNYTWDTSSLTPGTLYTLRVFANDTSNNIAKGGVWQYRASAGLFIWNFNLNDTYIHINQSIMLTVNSSNATIVPYNVSAQVQLANGTYFNYTLTRLGNLTYHYNFTNADFGDTEDKCGLLNVTNVYAGNSTTIIGNTTTLRVDYGRTTELIEDHPDPIDNTVNSLLTFTSDFETWEDNDIQNNCTVEINAINGTDLTFLMTYGTNHSYVRNLSAWTLGGYTYNISCINNSYESQWLTGSFEIVSPGTYKEKTGGGDTGIEEEEEEEEVIAAICGDGICNLTENYTSCPQDCGFTFTYSPLELSYKNVMPGDVSIRKIKISNPTNDSIVVKLDIERGEDDSFLWSYFGASENTKSVQYIIEKNESQDVDVTINVPDDATFGIFIFNVRITQGEKGGVVVPAEIEIYKETRGWDLLMVLLGKEYKMPFAEGRYLMFPPLFMGTEFVWKWLYGVYAVIGIIVFLIIVKIISALYGSLSKPKYPRYTRRAPER